MAIFAIFVACLTLACFAAGPGVAFLVPPGVASAAAIFPILAAFTRCLAAAACARFRFVFFGHFGGRAAEPGNNFGEQTDAGGWGFAGFFRHDGRGLRRSDAFDSRFLAARRARFFVRGHLLAVFFRWFFHHFVRRLAGFFLVEIVVTHAGDHVLRRLEVDVGNQHEADFMPHFDGVDVVALFVE